jgi:hypothetical protein
MLFQFSRHWCFIYFQRLQSWEFPKLYDRWGRFILASASITGLAGDVFSCHSLIIVKSLSYGAKTNSGEFIRAQSVSSKRSLHAWVSRFVGESPWLTTS